MSYGKIEYNEEGLPKCEICGEHFKRVLSHVRQKHDMPEKEYKKTFGFDLFKGICSVESSERTRIKTLSNYDKCIKKNLLAKGDKTRFKQGHEGRTKDKISAQTMDRLIANLELPNMRKAMKENGKRVGNSGLGNITRWGKKDKDNEG